MQPYHVSTNEAVSIHKIRNESYQWMVVDVHHVCDSVEIDCLGAYFDHIAVLETQYC